MGQILHGSAKTTNAIRAELQRSKASAARFGINEKTVLKWRMRRSVEDMPMGPKERRSKVLTPVEGCDRSTAGPGTVSVGRCLYCA